MSLLVSKGVIYNSWQICQNVTFLNKKLIVKQREVIEMKTEEVIKIVEIVFEAALKITKAVVMEEGKKQKNRCFEWRWDIC